MIAATTSAVPAQSPREATLPDSRAPAAADDVAAFFDVDGTLVEGNVVVYYVRIHTQWMGLLQRAVWTAGFALRVPGYLALDLASRSLFQRTLYREYRRFAPEDLAARARLHFEHDLVGRLFASALDCIHSHRERGHRVVLVTGSLREIVAPLAEHVGATDLLAAELEIRDGAFTGALAGGALAGERKAQAVAAYVARHGLDARACHAYADSRDDIPMLGAVGHPHVVNPGGRLARVARRAGWDILRWGRG
jgi:HAD superfamily hydrolase (TIGR01490 family)